MKKYIIDENKNWELELKEKLIKHQYDSPALSDSWKFEIYFNLENKEVSTSSPMTCNSWTNDPEKIGTLKFQSLNDIDGTRQWGNLIELADGDVDEKLVGQWKKENPEDQPCYTNDINKIVLCTYDDYMESFIQFENFEEIDEIIEVITEKLSTEVITN